MGSFSRGKGDTLVLQASSETSRGDRRVGDSPTLNSGHWTCTARENDDDTMISPVWKITKQYQTLQKCYDVTIRGGFWYPPVDFGIAGSKSTCLLVQTVGPTIFHADYVTNQHPPWPLFCWIAFDGCPHLADWGVSSLLTTEYGVQSTVTVTTSLVTVCSNW